MFPRSAASQRSDWTTVNRLEVHARSWTRRNRSAAPIVLVHGFGVSTAYFVPLGDVLSHEYDVYAPDLPGHGKSQTPPRPLDIPQLAECLLEWLDHAKLPSAAIVGQSMGCGIAVDALARAPARFERLALVAPALEPAGRSLWRLLPRFFADVRYEHPGLAAVVALDYARMGLRLAPELRSMLRYRIEDRLPLVRAPTLLVRGERDPLVSRHWLVEMSQRMCDCTLVEIPGGGHALNYSAAPELCRAISGFLEAMPSRSN
jgi:2-hydroxy-6-oxonona-2,4-dienedioate hydrolase